MIAFDRAHTQIITIKRKASSTGKSVAGIPQPAGAPTTVGALVADVQPVSLAWLRGKEGTGIELALAVRARRPAYTIADGDLAIVVWNGTTRTLEVQELDVSSFGVISFVAQDRVSSREAQGVGV